MNAMLARLESSSHRQLRFVADASHELRTPLTRMRTTLEVDLAEQRSDFAETSRRVLGDAIEMQRLVDDLLFLARRDATPAASPMEPLPTIDLDVLVHDEVRRVRAEVAERGDVRIDMSAVSAAVVSGESGQLTRLVRNLLTNAIRHARSRVDVGLAESGDVVVLTVADDGAGIPIDQREAVFERFVRLDESRSTSVGGTGLGLAIVREIAIAHGGTVGVESARLGGALLTVRLPAGDPA
jgi:signal transduction histidine kinase